MAQRKTKHTLQALTLEMAVNHSGWDCVEGSLPHPVSLPQCKAIPC